MHAAETVRGQNPDEQGNAADADQRNGIGQIHCETEDLGPIAADVLIMLQGEREGNGEGFKVAGFKVSKFQGFNVECTVCI
jgi:hypothetical protein